MRYTLPSLFTFLLTTLLLASCGSSKKTIQTNWTPRSSTTSSVLTYNQYIEQNAGRALTSQRIFGVPAAITLAQGLLESGAGRSRLASRANNHFGIKCHNWRGEKFYMRDDGPNDCFRVYRDIQQSYDDHGRFLRDNRRYSGLFKLDQDDYKGWAKGLQKAGYATDRGYANKLIKIIEDNRLYLITDDNPRRMYAYNQPKQPRREVNLNNQPKQYQRPATRDNAPRGEREVYMSYGLLYVVAKSQDDIASIARDMGISERRLQNFNDFPKGYPLSQGDIVYLQKKLLKAEPPFYTHTVKVGESIHSIAQTYGLQLDALYRLNDLSSDYEPTEGDILQLR